MNHFEGKWRFYLAWKVRWCVRSGSIFCSAFSCPFPGITCVSFSPRLLFSICKIIGSGRWLLTIKRGLKTIYKKKKIHQFKANFISVLQALKQTIDKCLQRVILTLIYYMTHKAWTFRFQKHSMYSLIAVARVNWALKSKLCTTHM